MQHWSEDVVVAAHPNTQATAMSVNLSGHLVLLGSRRNLSLIHLDKPKEVLRRINLNNKWDISRAVWNRFHVNQQYFLTTYNQWTDLWHCENISGTGTRIATFSGHTRAISDVDWSACDPNLLATCSLDTYIYLWDIRDTKKPKLSATTVSGASCVRFNKSDENILASSHDGNIRIWDIRNGKTPMQYITAHVSKINNLDWSPVSRYELCSASQDTTVSFWDTSLQPRVAAFQIHSENPVWRAEYTPFGSALSSVSFKNFRETPFALWSIDAPEHPVHMYTGHSDVVLDFHWRCQNGKTWQLITWTKDQVLRLWMPERSHLLKCGVADVDDHDVLSGDDNHIVTPRCDARINEQSLLSSAETQVSDSFGNNLTPDLSRELSLATEHSLAGSLPGSTNTLKLRGSSSSFPHTLEQEFKLLNVNLPTLSVRQMDKNRRLCVLALRTSAQHLVLNITFPIHYPQNEAPIFKFTDWSETIDAESREKLLQTLHETAQHLVRNNRSCLEPCLRQLTTQFRSMSYNGDNFDPDASFPRFSNSFASGNFYQPDLHNVPFPRTSGARFCGSGYLVVFLRPTYVKGFHCSVEKTPRSYGNLLTHRKSVPLLPRVAFDSDDPSDLRVSSFYYKEKRLSRKSLRHCYNPTSRESPAPTPVRSKPPRPHHATGRVVVIDMTRIMPVSKGLAHQYIVPQERDFAEACRRNREEAAREDMSDLVQLWSCVAFLPHPTAPPNEMIPPFHSSPMGRSFLTGLLDHYSRLKDVQTLAMLSCTFDSPPKPPRRRLPAVRSSSHQNFAIAGNGQFGSIHKSSSEAKLQENQGLSTWLSSIMSRSPASEASRFLRSPSESPPDHRRLDEPAFNSQPTPKDFGDADCRMLEPQCQLQYDAFKTSYSSLLQRWKINVKAAEIMKHANASTPQASLEFRSFCATCGEAGCSSHRSLNSISCVICSLPVKESWSFCGDCFHGGHTDHVTAWFAARKICPSPSNCKCQCVIKDFPGATNCDVIS